MAKRSVSEFRPKGLRIGEAFYTDQDIDRIVEAAGPLPDGEVEHRRPVPDGTGFETVIVFRREALSDRLESAARAWDIAAQFQTKPTTIQAAESHERIAKCAARLLKALEMPEAGDLDDMPPAIRYGPMLAYAEAEGQNLDEAVLVVQGILRWSRQAAEEEMEPRSVSHEGDTALNALFRSLIRIWVEIFEQKITTRETTLKGGSTRAAPTIRFVQAALRPILKDATPSTESIRDRVRRLG